MKPRTKIEREVDGLARKLPNLSKELVDESKEMRPKALVHKEKAWCSECGSHWQINKLIKRSCAVTTCPHCGKRLLICVSSKNKRVDENTYYFSVLTTEQDFQIARTFQCTKKSKRNEGIVAFSIDEAFQIWMKPGKKKVIYGRRVNMNTLYYDSWCFKSPMEIRANHYRYEVEGFLSKKVKLLPIVKRNGLKRLRDNISYVDQVYGVMNDPKCEILAKAKQWSMLERVSRRNTYDEKLWPAVRIAIRHGYTIKDAHLWTDMVSMLSQCGKDIHNPKYVCPKSLREGHDLAQRLNDKRIEKENEERRKLECEELVKKLQSDSTITEKFMSKIARWRDKEISVGDITIKPLQSIMDFKKEGDTLHHCVFSNKYYEQDDCLILGARVNGKRTETIEIDTQKWQIVQCRGSHNQPSKYHNSIMKVMKANMKVFQMA